jgi:hypothetical protein
LEILKIFILKKYIYNKIKIIIIIKLIENLNYKL